MPFYEYRCGSCGHEFEARHTVEERDRPLPCPECRSAESQRKLSRFAVSGASASAGPGGCPPERARQCGNYG